MLVVKKDYETARNTAYTVINKEKGTKHSVIYKFEKKKWSCDCTWNSLKETHCSHIKAVIKKRKGEKAKSLVKKLGI
jgi:hypothetical protein